MTEDEIRLAAEALGVIPRSKTRPKSLEVPPGGLSQAQRQTQQTLSEGIKSAAERREAEESEAWGQEVAEKTTPLQKVVGGLEATAALPSAAVTGILGHLGEGFKLLPPGGADQFVAENFRMPRGEAGQYYFDVMAGGVDKAADWFGETPLGEFLGTAFEKLPGIFPVSATTAKAVDEGLAGAGKGLKLAAEQARKQRQYETGQEGAFYRVRPVTEETGRALRGNKEEAGGGAETPGGPVRGDVPQPITDDALTEVMAQPDNFVRSVASDYAQQVNGRPYELPDMAPSSLLKQAPIGRVFDLAVSENPQYKKAVFEAYGRSMPEVIEQSGAKNYDQLVEAAYRQLAKETDDQFRRLPVNMSYHRAGEGNYSDSRDMLRDVYGNRHLYVFQGGDPHPFLSRVDPETGLNDNEKFRAVHDFFGHAIHGNQFGPKGEETAWLAHSQMYSPLARLAMSTETRGQNSVVNYTPLNAKLKARLSEIEGRIYEARRRGQTDDLKELQDIKKGLFNQFQFAPQYGLLLPPEMIRPDFAGKMPDYVRPLIQPAPGTATGARLFHYGKEPGIKVTDPSRYGTGIKGAEAARLEGAPDIRPRTYFYTDPTKPPEAGLGPYRYRGEADLYNLEEDPLAFRTLAAESLRSPFTSKVNPGMVDPGEAITAAERLVKEYGYPGYMTPGSGTAAVFQPVPVQQYAEGGEVTKEDDPGRLQGLIMLYQAGLLSLDELTKEMRGMHPYDVAKIFGGTDSNPLPEMPTEFSGLERLPFLPYHSYDPERENLTLDDLARLGEGETEEEFKFRGSPNIKRLERTPGFVSSNPSDEIDLATGGAVTMAKGGKVAKGMSGISAAREAMKAQRQTSKNLSKKDLVAIGAELETSTGQLPEIAKKYPQIKDASVAELEEITGKSPFTAYRGVSLFPGAELRSEITPSTSTDPSVAINILRDAPTIIRGGSFISPTGVLRQYKGVNPTDVDVYVPSMIGQIKERQPGALEMKVPTKRGGKMMLGDIFDEVIGEKEVLTDVSGKTPNDVRFDKYGGGWMDKTMMDIAKRVLKNQWTGGRDYLKEMGGFYTNPEEMIQEFDAFAASMMKDQSKKKGGKVTKGAMSGLSSAREAMKAQRREERVQKNLEAYMGSTEKPQTYYHATQAPKDFRKFDLDKRPTPKSAAAVFLTPSTEWANEFDMADLKTLESATSAAPRIMPMITRAKNTFDYEDPGHVTQVMNQVELPPGIDRQHVADEIAGGNWNFIEDRNIQKAIKDLGFDSFNVKEKGVKNLGVFNPADVKSLFNRGSYDPTTEDISKAAGGPVLKGIAKARAEAKMSTGGKAVKGVDSALSGIAAARATQKAQRAKKDKDAPVYSEQVLQSTANRMAEQIQKDNPKMPADKVQEKAQKQAAKKLTWERKEKPELEKEFGELKRAPYSASLSTRQQNVPAVVQQRIEETERFLAQPTEPWQPPRKELQAFDRERIKDALEGFPGIEQTRFPRYQAPRSGALSMVQEIYQDPVNRRLIEGQIKRGLPLGGETFYASLYPLKLAALERGIPEEQFNKYIYSIAPASARNSIMNEMAVGQFLRNMHARGLPLDEKTVEKEMERFKNQYGTGLPLMPVHRLGVKSVLEEDIDLREHLKADIPTNYKIYTYGTQKAGDFGKSVVQDVHEAAGQTRGSRFHPYFTKQGGFSPTEYGPAEDQMLQIAQGLGIPGGMAQAGRWFGGGELTGLKSPRGDALDLLERQAAFTLHGQGINPTPRNIRNFVLDMIETGEGELMPYFKKTPMPDYRTEKKKGGLVAFER